uniref:Zinc finger, BED-type n=1 Tax=Helianthus annuus TaxID=4232 RepID=A0A251U7W7_HELAN
MSRNPPALPAWMISDRNTLITAFRLLSWLQKCILYYTQQQLQHSPSQFCWFLPAKKPQAMASQDDGPSESRKTDPGWKYNHLRNPNDKNAVSCNFCKKITKGGNFSC